MKKLVLALVLPLVLLTQDTKFFGKALGGTAAGVSSFAPNLALTYQLVAYWNLDELSGTRAKTAGTCVSCDLTAVNAPLASGGAGNYALVTSATPSYVSASNIAQLQGSDDMAVCAWVRPTSVTGTQRLVDKDTSAGPSRDFLLYLSGTSAAFVTDPANTDNVTSAGAVALNTRTLLCGIHYSATHKAGISVNGAAATLSTGTFTTVTGTAAFSIGSSVSFGSPYAGTIGPVMKWSVSLDSTALSNVYNSGNGYTCGTLPAALKANLIACWDLQEASGTRAASSVGSCTSPTCDLTAVNAPGRAVGLVQNGMGMSANFIYTSTQGLSSSAASLRNAANTSMTQLAWVNLSSITGTNGVIFSQDDTVSDRDWTALVGATASISAFIGDSGGGLTGPWSGGTLTVGQWGLVELSYDQTTKKLTTYLNGASVVASTALTNGIKGAATAPYTIGVNGAGTPAQPVNASVDAVGYWSRVLTDSERTALYASGAGVEYPWANYVDLFQPSGFWADRSLESKQRAIWAKTGVYVPEYMFPSSKVIVLH